jgi:cyclase
MNRTLIVARMDPADTEAVANVFAESDASPLPHLVGVRSRTLFTFHGLYLHLIEADDDVRRRLPQVRDNPHWNDVNTRLGKHIEPYDPQTWRSPKDAMARAFYTWAR